MGAPAIEAKKRKRKRSKGGAGGAAEPSPGQQLQHKQQQQGRQQQQQLAAHKASAAAANGSYKGHKQVCPRTQTGLSLRSWMGCYERSSQPDGRYFIHVTLPPWVPWFPRPARSNTPGSAAAAAAPGCLACCNWLYHAASLHKAGRDICIIYCVVHHLVLAPLTQPQETTQSSSCITAQPRCLLLFCLCPCPHGPLPSPRRAPSLPC